MAINVLCAKTLVTAFASSYIASFFSIHTSISVKDDIGKGSTYYLEEIEAVYSFIEVADATDFPRLLVLDELFKGTNTTEQIAVARAVLEYLCRPQHLVLVSTHDLELAALLQHTYELYHFSETVADGKLLFDHKIKEGLLRSRNAIRLLEVLGFPEEIVQKAFKYTGAAERRSRFENCRAVKRCCPTNF